MARIFVLDDEIHIFPRNQIQTIFADHKLTLATSREDANNKWGGSHDVVLLDHDMRGFFDPSTYSNTGYMFLSGLLASRSLTNQLKESIVLLHSQNAEGRQNMSELLTRANVPHESHSYGPSYLIRLVQIARELTEKGL